MALVTGANRGIGKAIVESFLSHGAKKVYLAVRNVGSVRELEDRFGQKVVTAYLDLSKPESITALAKQATDVHVVVNNAAYLTTTTPLDDRVEEIFLEELEINTLGLLRMAKAFAPILEKNAGAFVQLNSVASIISSPKLSTYSASKAASYSFTLALKHQFDDMNIQLLSVHPGPIHTEMADQAGMLERAEPTSVVSEGIVKSLENGEFLLFPDSLAREFWERYRPYADHYLLKND